jgi:hypothetical protein
VPDERQVLLRHLRREMGNRLFDGQSRVYTVVGIDRSTQPATVTLRPGVTDPADTEGDVAGVGFLGGYIPVLADIVQVINSNGSPYVIGSVDPNGAGARIARQKITTSTGTFNDTADHTVVSTTALLLPGHLYEVGCRWRGIVFGTAGTTICVAKLVSVSPLAVQATISDSNIFGGSVNAHEAGDLTAEFDSTGQDCTSAWTFTFLITRAIGASTYSVSATTASPARVWVDDLGRA